MLQGHTVIGDGSEIGPDTRLVDCVVGDGRRGRADRRPPTPTVGDGRQVGPYAVLGPGSPGSGRWAVTGPFYTRTPDALDRLGGSMELVTKKRLHLFAGSCQSRALAEEIADRLGVRARRPEPGRLRQRRDPLPLRRVASGAPTSSSSRRTAVATDMSINDAIMEQLIMVDAAQRASAKRITVVCPFYGYARQDRKAEGREPITAKLVANMFTAAGAKRLVSVDLHSGQIQGFFDGPVDHLTAMPVLVDYIREHLPDDLVVVSPDAGRVKVAERYANQLHADLAIVHKRRCKGVENTVEAKEVVGDVEGRTCVLIDDMIDTGGTIGVGRRAARRAGRHGGLRRGHPRRALGPGHRPAQELGDRAGSWITNTLPLPPEKQIDKIEVLSVAKIIADAIDAVFEDTSVSRDLRRREPA